MFRLILTKLLYFRRNFVQQKLKINDHQYLLLKEKNVYKIWEFFKV